MSEILRTPDLQRLPDLTVVMGEVAEKGVGMVESFLPQREIDLLLDRLRRKNFQEIDILYENGVRESHHRYTMQEPDDLISQVVKSIRDAVRRTGRDYPSLADWFPNDVAFQVYGGTSGISSHRDHSRYKGVIAALTLQGSAVFTVHNERTSSPFATYYTMPGDAIFLRSSGLNHNLAGHPGLFHAVGPALGNEPRISMGLRDG